MRRSGPLRNRQNSEEDARNTRSASSCVTFGFKLRIKRSSNRFASSLAEADPQSDDRRDQGQRKKNVQRAFESRFFRKVRRAGVHSVQFVVYSRKRQPSQFLALRRGKHEAHRDQYNRA